MIIKKFSEGEIKGMFLAFSDKVWGNLKTCAARNQWAKAQPARYKAEDAAFREELILIGWPDFIAKMAWAEGSREKAIQVLSDAAPFIKYYNLEAEVKSAFKKHMP